MYQVVQTSADERLNLLINVLFLFSAPLIAGFVIYFILSSMLIFCTALFAQFMAIIIGIFFLVPTLIFSTFLGLITTGIIISAKARWFTPEENINNNISFETLICYGV
uniref:Uncharacterized protein n=1 Tax=Ditylenchus dipsaci TaxID=166011 RepID=A0A915DU05_9BILA